MALRCARCLELVGRDSRDLWHKAVGHVSYDPSSISFQQGWAPSSRRWYADTARACSLDGGVSRLDPCLDCIPPEGVYDSSI
jgi:hypothetical protein